MKEWGRYEDLLMPIFSANEYDTTQFPTLALEWYKDIRLIDSGWDTGEIIGIAASNVII